MSNAEPTTIIRRNGKTATVQPSNLPNCKKRERWYFSVWSPHRGYIASGFRATKDDALHAAQVVLSAKGNN